MTDFGYAMRFLVGMLLVLAFIGNIPYQKEGIMYWNLGEPSVGIILLIFIVGGITEAIDDHLEYIIKKDKDGLDE